MKTRFFATLLLLSLILSSTLQGQKIFREGFIINNNGDTIVGHVRFNFKAKRISQVVHFKQQESNSVTEYTPYDIAGYGYKNGNFFPSKDVFGYQKFVECYVSGKLSLYAFNHKIFIHKENEIVFTELTVTPYTLFTAEASYDYANYLEFLSAITSDIKNFTFPKNLKYKASELAPAIAEYNKLSKRRYTVYNREISEKLYKDANIYTGKLSYSFGVMGTYNLGQTTLASSGRNVILTPDNNLLKSFGSLGVFYNRQISRRYTNLWIQTELQLLRQNNYFYSEITRPTPFEINRFDVYTNQTSIKLPVSLKYSIVYKGFYPFVSVGLAYSYSIENKSDGILEVEKENKDIKVFNVNKPNATQSPSQVNAFLGIGAKRNIFRKTSVFIESRFEFSPKQSQVFDFNDYYSPYYLPRVSVIRNAFQVNFVFGIGF